MEDQIRRPLQLIGLYLTLNYLHELSIIVCYIGAFYSRFECMMYMQCGTINLTKSSHYFYSELLSSLYQLFCDIKVFVYSKTYSTVSVQACTRENTGDI